MFGRKFTLALAAAVAVGCSETSFEPTPLEPFGPQFNHFSDHEAGPHYDLTLTAAEAATPSLATSCNAEEAIVGDERDDSLRAGVQSVGNDGTEQRFQLRLTGVEVFGDETCLGNVRPDGDWRDDLLIEHRQRGRHAPELHVTWHFQHEGVAHDLRTGWTTVEADWQDITSGQAVTIDGTATIREGRSVVWQGPLAFELQAEPHDSGPDPGDDEDDGEDDSDGGGNCPRGNPNHRNCT